MALPDFIMSSLVRTWIGDAVSAVARLMLEPVISTRWMLASCAKACWAIKPAATTLPEKIRRTERDKTVSIIITNNSQEKYRLAASKA
ncbi:hypothetical protein D3C86_2028220 [compost metagenome]